MAQNKSYSDLFSYSLPEYRKKFSTERLGTVGYQVSPYWTVDDGTQIRPDSDFDKLMKGYDSTSDQYINQLKSIYNDFGKNADEYKNNLLPVLDNLTGDIEKQQEFSDRYQKLLDENKDAFNNGVVLDPNANRTRAEYMGNVSSQFSNARNTLKRNMESQGLNPYENKGAMRDLELKRAQGLGMAAGRAYTDWRASYNRDKQANLANRASYLGLAKGAGDQLNNISNLRLSKAGLYGSILGAQNTAANAKQQGINTALDYNEGRRAEFMQLQQAKQQSDLAAASAKNRMTEKLQTEQLDMPLNWGQIRRRIK